MDSSPSLNIGPDCSKALLTNSLWLFGGENLPRSGGAPVKEPPSSIKNGFLWDFFFKAFVNMPVRQKSFLSHLKGTSSRLSRCFSLPFYPLALLSTEQQKFCLINYCLLFAFASRTPRSARPWQELCCAFAWAAGMLKCRGKFKKRK